MKTNMYVIYDAKAQIYNKPFHQANEQVLMRTVSDLRNEPGTDIFKHPSDFNLYQTGVYDDETGIIHGMEKKLILTFVEVPSND